MKRLIYLLAFLAQQQAAYTQTLVQSSCTAGPETTYFWLEHASKFALKEMLNHNDPHKDSMHIPRYWQDSLLRPLLAVYNATNLPAHDTVFDLLNITYNWDWIWESRHFYIAGDSTIPWINNLSKNIIPTGFQPVDSLIELSGAQEELVDGNPFNSNVGIYLESDSDFNYVPVTAYFESLPNIQYSQAYRPGGTPSINREIRDSLFDDHVQLRYTYGWGDCPSGCIYDRTWVFNVYADCMVEYAGSYGDELYPTAVEAVKPKAFAIGPNPTREHIDIATVEPAGLWISDLLGRTMIAAQLDAGQRQVDVSTLPPGVYVYSLRMQSSGKQHSGKLIKE